MLEFASTALLVLSGVTAGVLFAVALSVVPAFLALEPAQYVQTHQLVGRRFDRVMPPAVLSSVLLATGLAAATGQPLYGLGAALSLGVSLVSQFGNVPINRRVKKLDPSAIPADWSDPRLRWRRWHHLRTSSALLALLANAAATALAAR
ncbi:MAG: DUF1772 domain-containing protein [Micromonosporaceae bacterium]|nr:DUF1772 domain-containing protein [Micromonosporaceae bacterium]